MCEEFKTTLESWHIRCRLRLQVQKERDMNFLTEFFTTESLKKSKPSRHRQSRRRKTRRSYRIQGLFPGFDEESE
jgi:hypothetical protein